MLRAPFYPSRKKISATPTHIWRTWYFSSYTITAKTIKMLELHYPMIQFLIIYIIIHSKIIPRFWLGKTTRIIHHNQLLNCHIEPLTEETCGRGWVVLVVWKLFEQNGGAVGRTLYSFHSEILSKNIARTARSQLNGQHLLFGVYLQSWADLYLLNFPKKMQYRCEFNIDRGKHF